MMPSDAELERAWDSFEAEMARQPTDNELEEFMAQFADELDNIADDRYAEAARALLSRYGSCQPAASAEPSGYAYRYPDGIRFNDGREVNGCKPTETLPYWFGAAPVAQEPENAASAEPIAAKRITAHTMVGLKAAVYKHHGWARAAGESMSARISELYDVIPDHKVGRFVAIPKSTAPVAAQAQPMPYAGSFLAALDKALALDRAESPWSLKKIGSPGERAEAWAEVWRLRAALEAPAPRPGDATVGIATNAPNDTTER